MMGLFKALNVQSVSHQQCSKDYLKCTFEVKIKKVAHAGFYFMMFWAPFTPFFKQ